MDVTFAKVSVDAGGKGKVTTYIDGKTVGVLTNRPTMWGSSTRINNTMIFSYWNGGSPQTQFLYFDDLVITNEVGAAPNPPVIIPEPAPPVVVIPTPPVKPKPVHNAPAPVVKPPVHNAPVVKPPVVTPPVHNKPSPVPPPVVHKPPEIGRAHV